VITNKAFSDASLVVILSTLMIACGTVSVVSKPNQKISRAAKITVLTPAHDPQNISGQLEHLLLEQGFEVTSEIVGRSELEYKEAEASDPGSRMTAGSISQVHRLPASLVLRFSYNAYYDVFYWSFIQFNGTVVDLESGAVVASVKFSGDRSVDSVLTEFVNQLANMSE
jgi:hypothetical protein